jgi:hypothetical protein
MPMMQRSVLTEQFKGLEPHMSHCVTTQCNIEPCDFPQCHQLQQYECWSREKCTKPSLYDASSLIIPHGLFRVVQCGPSTPTLNESYNTPPPDSSLATLGLEQLSNRGGSRRAKIEVSARHQGDLKVIWRYVGTIRRTSSHRKPKA